MRSCVLTYCAGPRRATTPQASAAAEPSGEPETGERNYALRIALLFYWHIDQAERVVTMDFSFSDNDIAFGERVREWAAGVVEPDWRAKHHPSTPSWIALQKEWDRQLYAGGFGGVFWPEEHGGLGASLAEKVMFARVMADVGAPEGLGKLGKRLVAPIVMGYGTEAQQQRYLPAILRGEEFWCQGFSEPGAGSDLASLRTKGVVDGDTVRITGQKVWTSHAWYCDWCFALVRTDPDAPKHEGISLVFVPTDAPGLEIRSVRQINRKHEFAEAFFDDVVVPLDNVIGPLNGGWQVAMSILAYERGAEMAFARLGEARPGLAKTLRVLADAPPLEQATSAVEIGRIQTEYFAFQINAMRLLATQLQGGNPSEIASVSRLQSSEGWRAGTVSQLALSGPSLLADADEGWHLYEDYLTSRAATIAAGTSEIQRTIISRRILGMR